MEIMNIERVTLSMNTPKEYPLMEDDRKAIKEIKVPVHSLEQFSNLPEIRKENGCVYHKHPGLWEFNFNGKMVGPYALYMRK
jgi:hypothetical protein